MKDKLELIREAYRKAEFDSEFEDGDKVIITRSATNDEYGWQNGWLAEMSSMVGKTGTVMNVPNDGTGIAVKFEKDEENVERTFRFPFFVLKKVEERKFNPFDKVLVKSREGEVWEPAIYHRSCIVAGKVIHRTSAGEYFACIPYEGNEHLVGVVK